MIKSQFKIRHKITHVYAPVNRSSKCVNQKLTDLKGEIEKYTMIVKDFNTLFLVIERYRSSVNQLDLINIYRMLHPRTVE